MKKKEKVLHWDEYEAGDLVRSAHRQSGLETGTVYEVVEFLGPYTESIQDLSLYSAVSLKDEEGNPATANTALVRPANWWIEIRIDETRHWDWHTLNAILGKEGKVYGVYIYNEMEHTYCCETRPSCWLRHVYDFSSVMLPEKMMGEFDHHSNVDSNDHYFHTTDIDALPDSDKFELGIFGSLGDASEEIEEQVREHIQGNPNWC